MYLSYFEVLEAGAWKLGGDLKVLKNIWCFTNTIFDVGDMTREEFDSLESPLFDYIYDKYPIIFQEGSNKWIHQKRGEVDCGN